MNMTHALLFAMAVFGMTSEPVGAAGPEVTEARKDGLRAKLAIEDNRAEISWRFTAPDAAPIENMTAHLNGRPTTISQEAYPAADDFSALLFIVDITSDLRATAVPASIEADGVAAVSDDPAPTSREAAIDKHKARLITLYDSVRPHHTVAVGAIAERLKLAVSDDGEPIEPLDVMLDVGTSDAEPDLGEAIASITDVLASTGAARKAAFLFTDGYSKVPPDWPELLRQAQAADVSFTILAEPSERPADLQGLLKFAADSGGRFGIGDASLEIVYDPFWLVDSGGRAVVDVTDARRYFWEPEARLVVSFERGADQLHLESVVDAIPRAGLSETVAHIGREYPLALAGASAMTGLLGMIGIGLALLQRRRWHSRELPR